MPRSRIDGDTHATQRISAQLLDAYGVTVDTTRNLIYATSIYEGRLAIIDGATHTLLGKLDLWRGDGRKVPLRVIAVNPNVGTEGHLLLVTSSEDGGEDQVLLIPNGWPDASLAVTPLPAAPEHVLPANACVNLAVCLIGVVLLLAGLRLMRRR